MTKAPVSVLDDTTTFDKYTLLITNENLAGSCIIRTTGD
jgi:hypothetical protein